ncbi:MAG: hypothetical protein ACKO23_00365 [Gemmataceae bacterium]
MPRIPVLLPVVCMLLVHGRGTAQTARDLRQVQVERAEVRSGPSESDQFYASNHILRGQTVEVLEELPGGWLAIRPPQGSFSYINTRFVRQLVPDMPTNVVTLDGVKVPVFIGSEIHNKRPAVVGASLEPGAQVMSRGKPVNDEDGSWMPIDPPEKERRYIRATQVSKAGERGIPVAAVSSQSLAPQSSFTPYPMNATPVSTASAPLTLEQQWYRAVMTEQAGQTGEAIRLYSRLASDSAAVNPNMANAAAQRARYLQGTWPPPATPVAQSMQTAPPGYCTTSPVLIGQPPAATVQRTSPMEQAVVPSSTPLAGSQATAVANRGNNASWVGYRGILRKAGRTIEGQTTYALDDPTTMRPVVYAVPGRGNNLEPHVNRPVQLWGYSFWRGDLRNNFMTVVHVVPES